MTGDPWTWDRTLYAGSAAHYSAGRMPYPPALAEILRTELGLDGQGRLLDVGCGPGSLTLLLAPLFATATGVDADADMLTEAARRAAAGRLHNLTWHRSRAEDLDLEDLDPDRGTFQVVTFAQSFHWMDRPRVATRVRALLDPAGTWVHVGATTHQGVDGDDPLPHPRPPWPAITDLVGAYLGPVRRAGQGRLPNGTPGGEETILRDAGFTGPTRRSISTGQIVDRPQEQIVAAVLSLSGSAPHLFGARLPQFLTDLRRLLTETAEDGLFSERTHDIQLALWHP